MSGSATLTIVMSIALMNIATQMTPRPHHRLRAPASCGKGRRREKDEVRILDGRLLGVRPLADARDLREPSRPLGANTMADQGVWFGVARRSVSTLGASAAPRFRGTAH